MEFLADMGISQTVVAWLREQGHYAIHVRDEDMHRASDADIVKKAKDEQLIVLTCDLDFGAIMSALSDQYPSVVIFRLGNEVPLNVIRRLRQVFDESSNALKKGAIISVEETRHRVRALPL